MGRTVLAAVALVLAVAAPAFGHPGHDVPDFGSAVPVPSDYDYQITSDGHLIYEGDMVFGCEGLGPEDYTSAALYEEQAELCAEASFPPGETLPDTGGSPLLLPASFALLLGAGGMLVRAIAPVRS